MKSILGDVNEEIQGEIPDGIHGVILGGNSEEVSEEIPGCLKESREKTMKELLKKSQKGISR